LAPLAADDNMLGSTLFFYVKDSGRPERFVAPSITKDLRDTGILEWRWIRRDASGCEYWWIEWGGELDTVDDNERIRDELRGVILGIWDHIKNSGKFDADNLTLEWIGNVPGKREYRRFIGDYTLHQGDIVGQTEFADGVAFGGWSIDLHPAQGMYATGAGALQRFSDGVFEIPYRSLYSVNVENMLFAGRDVSATHIAFGAARVMATCGAMGQAAGTAAALCVEHGTTPRGVYTDHLDELRQTLLAWDAPLVGVANTDGRDLARRARVTASSTTTSIAAPAVGLASDPYDDFAAHDLDVDLGVVLPVDPRLDSIELLVSARRDTTLGVEVWSTGKPQNVVPVRLEAKTDVAVPAGDERWVTAHVPFAPGTPQNAVVVLRANPDLAVRTTAPLPPGVLTLVHRVDNDDQNVQVSSDELLVQWPTKPLRGRSVVFRAAPESRALAPERATGGYHRNHGGPNMWASAPMAPGREEWLRLDWDEPVTAREVRVVLDDDLDVELNTLHHHRTPDEVLPTLVRDYRLELLPDGPGQDWVTAASVTGNRHRLRVHPLPDVGPVRAARLVVAATNGTAQARVVALRVQE
jgi:hypothetical protein